APSRLISRSRQLLTTHRPRFPGTGLAVLTVALAGCTTGQYAGGPNDPYAALAARKADPRFPIVDLVAPAGDVWKRVRRGYAIPNLQSSDVDKWTEFYASRPDMVHRLLERSTKYLYYVVDEI